MKKLFFCLVIATGLVGLPIDSSFLTGSSESLALAAVTPRYTVTRGVIERGKTLAAALTNVISDREIHDLVESARSSYDLKDVRPGRAFRVSLNEDGKLRSFAYSIDELRTLRVSKENDALRSDITSRQYETRVETAAGAIQSSLFETIDAIGEKDELAMELAEIFAWDIDFNTAIQPGDTFRIVVEKLYLDGELRRYGRVLAAEFVNSGRVHGAVRFEADGRAAYYEPSGEPLKKAFLKSPLRFTRVSSGFSSGRYHPVLRYTRAHNGTDLAAGYGTPVRAIGHGTVVTAGFQAGGYGNLVVIRHANGYTSYYGHLSKILIRAGARVSQSDLVGLVGATGLATGPHLHYGIMKNGAWADPMRIQSPPAEPLRAQDRPAFDAISAQVMAMMPPVPAARTRRASNDARK